MIPSHARCHISVAAVRPPADQNASLVSVRALGGWLDRRIIFEGGRGSRKPSAQTIDHRAGTGCRLGLRRRRSRRPWGFKVSRAICMEGECSLGNAFNPMQAHKAGAPTPSPLNAGTTGLPIRLLDDYVVVRTDQASTCASLTEARDRKLLLRGNVLAPSQPNKNGENPTLYSLIAVRSCDITHMMRLPVVQYYPSTC